MTLIKLAGTALPWFQSAETFARERFSPIAFREFIRSPESLSTPVLFDHDHTTPIPAVGGVRWTTSNSGLAVAFSVDTSRRFGRQIVLAVRHGHLSRLSVQVRVLASEQRIERSGRRYQRVTQGEPIELSIVPEAAFRGTSIRIVGEPVPTVRSYPADASDREMLTAFLSLAGMDRPQLLPTVDSRQLFAPASLPVVKTPTASKKPVKLTNQQILAKYAGREICVHDKPPEGGGKTFTELMSYEQQMAALDSMLGIEPRKR